MVRLLPRAELLKFLWRCCRTAAWEQQRSGRGRRWVGWGWCHRGWFTTTTMSFIWLTTRGSRVRPDVSDNDGDENPENRKTLTRLVNHRRVLLTGHQVLLPASRHCSALPGTAEGSRSLWHLGWGTPQRVPPQSKRPPRAVFAFFRHVYNTTVPATCLPHTGFAGAWTPASICWPSFLSRFALLDLLALLTPPPAGLLDRGRSGGHRELHPRKCDRVHGKGGGRRWYWRGGGRHEEPNQH